MLILNHNLYIPSINAYIDPLKPVDKALITHAHADHARPNHNKVLATEDTINIMKIRYGNNCAKNFQIANYSDRIYFDGAFITFYPAGHILGSAQILIESKGKKVLVTGDYKTVQDETTQNFQLVKTDFIVTEATFGLPIFKHPKPTSEIKKLTNSVKNELNKNHLIGAYALGKSQRLISLLREEGYDDEIYIHGALEKISDYYNYKNIKLGKLKKINKENKSKIKGKIIIAPPSALKDRWSRNIPDTKLCLASGWMSVKQRAKQKLVELPLIISDHSDWNELTNVIKESDAKKVWITHGREEALKYWCKLNNIDADALSIKKSEDNFWKT